MPAAAGGDETNKAAQEATTTPSSAAPSEDAPLGSGGGVADLRLGERFRGLVRAYNEVEEKGTPLRPYIRSARESLNGAAVAVNVRGVLVDRVCVRDGLRVGAGPGVVNAAVERMHTKSHMHMDVQSQWVAAKEGACAAVESVKPDLSWISKGT